MSIENGFGLLREALLTQDKTYTDPSTGENLPKSGVFSTMYEPEQNVSESLLFIRNKTEDEPADDNLGTVIPFRTK